jgi:hypothetical protein
MRGAVTALDHSTCYRFRGMAAEKRKLAQTEFTQVGAGLTGGAAIVVALVFAAVWSGLALLTSKWSARFGNALFIGGLIASGAIATLARKRRESGVDRIRVAIGEREIVVTDGAGGRRAIPHAAVQRIDFGNVPWKDGEEARLEIRAQGHPMLRLAARGVSVEDFWSQLDRVTTANKAADIEPIAKTRR